MVLKRLHRFSERTGLPNYELFSMALLAWIIFLCVELFARIYDLYKVAPLIDVPTHFASGVALFTTFAWVLSMSVYKQKIMINFFLTLFAAIFWEILETVQEMIFTEEVGYLRDYFFWDGFFDIVSCLVGFFVAWYIMKLLKIKTENFVRIHIKNY